MSTANGVVDIRGDMELITQVYTGRDPLEVESLDFSLLPKKSRRALKTLRALEEFTNLKQLNLAGNSISSLDGVEVLVELDTLCLARNHLKRLDAGLFSLISLKVLDISGNFISHIPRGIAALEVLESLDLSGNNLSVLKEVDGLAKLANLHACRFLGNPFCKLPTYKDYIVSKMVSLEMLDDHAISDLARDKSRRRFSEDMFSKDKCLRESELAHENEQNKLREKHSALEAENQRLKGELQLKSKLLQNKSIAWSTATDQLLQLQQELAMLNLTRPSRSSISQAESTDAARYPAEMDAESPEEDCCPGHEQEIVGRRSPSDLGFPFADANKGVSNGEGQQATRPRSASSLMREVDKGSVHSHSTQDKVPYRKSSTLDEHGQYGHMNSRLQKNSVATSPRRFIDSACSPLQPSGYRASRADATLTEEFARPSSPVRCDAEASSPVTDRPASPMRQHSIAQPEMWEDEDYLIRENERLNRSQQFPIFEDDTACPAYDDANGVTNTGRISPRQSPRRLNKCPVPDQAQDVHDTSVPTPFLSPNSRSVRLWTRQQEQLGKKLLLGTASKDSPRRSQVLGLVDKENLARQIQALQSCKQSLLNEIAIEEHLLHDLKQESSKYGMEIERLDSNLQIMIGMGRKPANDLVRPRGVAERQREEETLRAKLELLRSKLHFAEDKEQEIEATIVRLTKCVLENDIRQAKESRMNMGWRQNPVTNGVGPFDKEIFTLTHKLQLVIIEKEDIHSEMSRLLNHLQNLGGFERPSIDPGTFNARPNEEEQSQEEVQDDSEIVFLEQQKTLEKLKKKRQEVSDRIKVKEDLLASLVAELKDVENELSYINEFQPHSPMGHRRARSLDSQPGSLSDLAECAITEEKSRAKAGHTVKKEQKSSPLRPVKKVSKPSTPSSSSDAAVVANLVQASAANVSDQFELKFKELFSPEVLEEIKRDILAKFSKQLDFSTSKTESEPFKDMKDLHEAIAAALETHMKLAMDGLMPKNDLSSSDIRKDTDIDASPGRPSDRANGGGADTAPGSIREGDMQWDQLDEFMPVDCKYMMKYRLVKKYIADCFATSVTNSKSSTRIAALQRVLKAWERLEHAEAECKIDPISLIEVDGTGKKKSSLKVFVMGARDLPTTHLRTKNLDPYVAVEVIYPDHVLPLKSAGAAGRVRPKTGSTGRLSFMDDLIEQPKQSFRTRTIKKSVYPTWDEEFEFSPIHSLKGYLHIRILNDRKLSREQIVGEAKIPLRVLVHQKKVVESFTLSVSTTPDGRAGMNRRSLTPKTTGGTVRLQIQLSFSRVEKHKQAVDELVTKYLQEYNHLPACIESLVHKHCEEECENSDSMQSERRLQSLIPSDEIQSYEWWKSQQQKAERDKERMMSEDSRRSPCATYEDRADRRAPSDFERPESPSGLSPTRSASLWGAPKSSYESSMQQNQFDYSHISKVKHPAMPDVKYSAGRAAKSPSSHVVRGHPYAPPVSSKTMVAQYRPTVKPNQVQSGAPSISIRPSSGFSMLSNTSARRKTMANAPTAKRNPECFDEYSPYHPDFQLLDPLDLKERTGQGTSRPRSTSHSVVVSAGRGGALDCSIDTDNRRTDLRIFKSPGFGRREPTTGYPERYIGLDSQTSERIKRIFGRIDGQ
ncbi:hypothetical protein Poli38472_005934 [Pythium oligandrum]|uniref:C2 domain-containing protein n=1 Tax=Pythium oligandrum TaxID=41045 RepID=A0A8K1CRG6_PYTOL|nr:hypothetical protein Poli38472_005934 [Pythium oligandrum]|eukprot:TMW68466.1 hypothetical protein Poli38472_005934 [Pythium oligandrum]